MKIELLNENKLKITFTCIELSKNEISLHTFLSSTSLFNSFIDTLISIAKNKLNFNPENLPIKSEIYFLNNTQFTIYITIKNDLYLSTYKTKRHQLSLSVNQEYVFIFNTQNDYINFIKRQKLYKNNKNAKIKLYLYNNIYFLLIHIKNSPLERTKKMHISFLDETAPYFTSNILISKIKEFGNNKSLKKM